MLNSLLTSGETVEAWATQRRVFALKHRRVLLAATTGRFIALTRRLIGGYDSADIRWQEQVMADFLRHLHTGGLGRNGRRDAPVVAVDVFEQETDRMHGNSHLYRSNQAAYPPWIDSNLVRASSGFKGN